MSESMGLMGRVEQNFPAPGFRENQKRAIAKIVKAMEDLDKDVIQLDAPTGAGKSLILHTAARTYYHGIDRDYDDSAGEWSTGMLDDSGGPPEPLGEGIFFTTPLNSLVDQIDDDEFIRDNAITLKGRNNYQCIHPEDSGTDVNEAICQRDDQFGCDMKDSCDYYGRKYQALQHPELVTSMSYLMAEGMIPAEVEGTFGNRDVLVVDECQKLEDFAMNFISFTVSRRTVPDDVWSNVDIPDEDKEDDVDYLIEWVEDILLTTVREAIEYRESQVLMSKEENNELEDLKQFRMRVNNFLEDVEENDWIAQIEFQVKKNSPNEEKIIFKPVEIGRFLEDLLWSRADKIILSSATIPKGNWMSEIGLGNKDAGRVTVPSTFPVENRPIITEEAVGKMTYNERGDNAEPMAKKIKEIAEHHDGKGMIHCRSYGIADLLKSAFSDMGEYKWFNDNCMMQDKYNREESLEEWQESDKQVFFSVAMDEGVDLEGDDCRWQVLAKTLYKSMADKRVKYRVQERKEWNWYNRHAAIQIAQAYGRAVRGPEDWAYFYILDQSAVGLIERSDELFPDWFLEAVDQYP